MNKHAKYTAGFTLLEILIALAIFTILATLSFSVLDTVFKAQESTDAVATELSELQVAVALLQRDLAQVTNRPVREENGELVGAFIGTATHMEFTRGGFVNPLVNNSSDLLRVAYSGGEQFNRVTWQVLDRAPDSDPSLRELFKAQNVRFTYYDARLKSSDKWPLTPVPTQTMENSAPEDASVLPHAVLITLDIPRQGPLTFFIYIPAQPELPEL